MLVCIFVLYSFCYRNHLTLFSLIMLRLLLDLYSNDGWFGVNCRKFQQLVHVLQIVGDLLPRKMRVPQGALPPR